MKKLLFILTALFITSAFSQEREGEDLKVGLVLSGGGAKGLAHIGVLEAIEDAGIRIDYVGGTSMGAIVGGLYASGYSAKQLDSIFRKVDFDKLIQDEVPRKAKTFYEKDEAEKYALTLPFDKFEIGFPSGLSKGQNLYNLFSRLTSHVSTVNDFSKLPIPFFCIATNAENGEQVMLEKGYLPKAISASGALPSLFSPVVINGDILIDGGVINNYPIEELKAKGVDIIIGVDVQDDFRDRKELKSAVDMMVQINNYSTVKQMMQKRKFTDVYIHPDINDYTVVSFDEGASIIESGAIAGQKVMKDLVAIANRQKYVEPTSVKFNYEDEIYITEVTVNGNKQYTNDYVLGKLKLKIPAIVSYEDFSVGVNNLSATGNFETIDYRFKKDTDGSYIINFNVRESPSRMLLRLGLHYDPLFKTGALINVTRKRLFSNNDIASLDFIVGDNVRYNFNYYIDKGFYWSVGFNSSYHFFDNDIAIDFIANDVVNDQSLQLNEIELQYSDFTNRLYAETLFRRSFLLGIGAEHKYLRYLSETIGIDENNSPRTVFESTNYYSAFSYLKYDTYDNVFFPNEGMQFEGNFSLYAFAEGRNKDFEPFSIARARAGYAKGFGDKFSAVLSAEGGFKIGGNNTQSLDFFLGGYGFKEINNIIPFYGYEPLSLRGNTYLKSSLILDYEILRKNHLNLFINIANVGEDLFDDSSWIDSIDYSGIGFGYGLETFLGPLEIKYAYSPERAASEWYVKAGFRF